MSASLVPQDRRLYGNWIQQASSGIAGAGALGTGIALGGVAITMLALTFFGWQAALFIFVLTVLAFAMTTRTFRLVGCRIAYLFARSRGEHQFRSGMFSRNTQPEVRLPGMLGGLELLERDDALGAHGERFAVIKNPRLGGLYTVVARCVADGPWMQDQPHIDAWVASYAGVLAALGHDPAVECAKAITDTAPDPGGRLSTMVQRGRVDGTPAVSRQVIDECLATYPAASSDNVTYFEITFRGRTLNRKGDETAILSELARRVPNIRGRLEMAGGGAVNMVSSDELPAIVRAAYDPAAQPFLEQATLAGHRDTVDFVDAGPVAYEDRWDELLHDSGRSVTWEMLEAPRASVTERSLTALLAPSSDFARKRVALIYRPHTPSEAAEVSESDMDTAVFNADQTKKRIKARAKLRVQATERSRNEVATGAGMVRFSLLITGTVLAKGGDMEQAAASVESNVGAVLMKVRRCYGSQAGAFAATLPLGFVPWLHTAVPDKVRDLL